MNHYIKSIALIVIIGFSSCEKDADVKLPEVESKLVINSFISPQDTLVRVTVSISQPLYNNSNSGQYTAISNATVQINDGTNFQTLTYNSDYNYYFISSSQFPITVGTTYYLAVSTPDGKNVSASTTVPSLNSTLTFSSQNVFDPNSSFKYFFKTQWNDFAGTENYYRIVYYDKEFDGVDTVLWSAYSKTLSDKGKDGGIINHDFEVYTAYITTGNGLGELQLIHASKEYYLFHSKLLDAAFSGGPFSEPVQMYSNITGGFGVFAGFNAYKVSVIL